MTRAIDMTTRQKDAPGMTTAELREACRKYIPEALKQLAYLAETASSEKVRKEAEKSLTERGYVRTAKRDGDVLNINWSLKK